ncbi:transposase [Micromonospora sp. BRA006-A]|nr:transposase [Micromonospora sp. BRA006-A]
MSLYPIVDAQSASPRRYPPQRVRRERAGRRGGSIRDLTDAQWALIAPLVTPPVGGRRGRPPAHPMRAIVAAILYVTCTGCPWRACREFPPPGTVYWWFARWRDDHTLMRLHDRLREQCRTAAGRHRHPTAGAIDSQSVRAADTVPDAAAGSTSRRRSTAVNATSSWTPWACYWPSWSPARTSMTAASPGTCSGAPDCSTPACA